ncbi:MAG: hypothetical protein EHM32_12420, partial [Spirochaetales bacterium]
MQQETCTRKSFLKKTITTAGTLGAFGSFPALAGCSRDFSSDPEKPNVILITADDLGWKDTSCYGNKNISTPNIDGIARQGVKFTNAFVVSSSCSPSRASLITGQYPHTNGVTGLTHVYKTRALSPFHRTLPDILNAQGYNTAIQGKWHVSPYLPVGWYGYNERLSGILPGEWHIHDAKKSIDFIKRNRRNRFYLEINFMQTHREDSGEFNYAPGFPVDPESIRVPEYMTLPDWIEIRRDLSKYYSQLLHMDAIIGDILKALDEMGLAENTLVVFLGDNGPPYPGNKMTLYDRGAGVPLIMRWPKRIAGNRAEAGLVNSIDIMPTILEACGVPSPKDTQGTSILTVAEGRGSSPHEAIFLEMTNHVFYIPTRAVRTSEVEIHPQLFRHHFRAGPEQTYGVGAPALRAEEPA